MCSSLMNGLDLVSVSKFFLIYGYICGVFSDIVIRDEIEHGAL